MNEKVLIVEDDPAMLRGLRDAFVRKGYDVCTATDGEQGLDAALDKRPDLIVLDLNIPKINGFEVCRLLREEKLDTPVIMLTARDEESDILLGLNIGADDYMTKPFSIRELLARVNAILRRRRPIESQEILFGSFKLEPLGRRLLKNGEEVELTPKEYDLLHLFATNPHKAFARREILNRVWGYGVFVTDRSVDRAVTTLRSKIGEDPACPRLIETVRSVGYRFNPEGAEP